MQFNLAETITLLERTPNILKTQLTGLPEEWIMNNEGENSWNVYDIVGHLIHGELTDWMPRLEIILNEGTKIPFEPFDRFAQFENSKGKNLTQLLNEFEVLRHKNLNSLKQKQLSEKELLLKGIHPVFGEVTLKQLLSTWPVHDLNHLSQINRVMAKQYKNEVGAWQAYLKILQN